MKSRIIFATSNEKKVKEVREILGQIYDIISLKDIDFNDEIPEPFDTIRQNSIYKANFFFEKTNIACIAEDSGLEVEALNGRPSAYSARYAGPERNDVMNYKKILHEMNAIQNRNAQFVSIITYKSASNEEVFEGYMTGSIGYEPRGDNGFGYDPVFIPQGHTQTNAELSADEKNRISHRRKALDKLSLFMQTLNQKN